MNMTSVPLSAKRPRILIKAGKIACSGYNRNRDLKRLLGKSTLPNPGDALNAIYEIEGRLDALRREKAAEYSMQKHITVMAALLTELRFCRPSHLRLVD